jgi:hypothetical protein
LAEILKRDTPERRYLLGGLSEQERTRLEEAFFADDSKFEAVELAEDELIDAYVRGEFSTEEQEQFEIRLRISPRLIERVHFAKALAERKYNPLAQSQEVSTQKNSPLEQDIAKTKVRWWSGIFGQEPRLRVVFAACVVVILVGGVTLVTSWLRLRGETERINSERAALQRQKEELEKLSTEQNTRAEQLTAELQRAQDQTPAAHAWAIRAQDRKSIQELRQALKLKETGTQKSLLGTFAKVFLIPGSVRNSDAGQRELVIGPETKLARLQTALEKNDYPTYNATIQTADGSVVFRKNGLKSHNIPSGPQLLLSLPSRLLTPNSSYIVHVDGVTASGQVESVSDYQFRVLSRK